MADNLMRQGQSIVDAFYKQDDAAKNEYRIRLNTSIDVCRYLLRQRLPFRGHDESVESANRGNFIELVKYTADQNELVRKVVLENAPKNNHMVSHKIQTDLVHCFAEEVIESVIHEVNHDVFCLLVDESADVSTKEQVAMVFRFVDKDGIHLVRGKIWFEKTNEGSSKKELVKHLVRGKIWFEKTNEGSSKKELVKLMLLLLGITNTLSVALQRKDQDILNAMSLVKSTKQQLYNLRDNGWDSLVEKVNSFCESHNTELIIMEEEFVDPKKPRRRTNMTNLHHYQVECFYTVLDMQIQEFNDRFDESKLVRLSEFYPEDFSSVERISLEHQLSIYIDNIREDKRFANLESLGDLARVMMETKKHLSHPLVYRLLKLVLTLPVATATVERNFSAMKIV
ncbi:PREDICTED: uncharacterized protein LOC109129148 [Camelina sativa]|uniref:Uncharacterized protein LOC109129148 n=1 Tax=Camelina sativa TaxID=90675 RepID=A0ABM1R000_CAMSA|nr:PREDICTED: uncharacterized protein LOC109129148 [Camelina sativa]